jgi:hypothetical protein
MITAFTAIIPIAIIVALPILFFIFRGKAKYFNVKVTHWLLMIYTGVLLLSLIVFIFIKPGEHAAKVDEEQEWFDIRGAIHSGNISELEAHYLLEKYSFDYTEPTLNVTSAYMEYGSAIFVERKKEDDGKVDVHIYGTGLNIEGIDLSEKVITPSIRLNDKTLSIVYPEYQEINIALVKNEFTINQFTGESKMGMDYSLDSPILFIRIPHNLGLKENADMFLNYVGD